MFFDASGETLFYLRRVDGRETLFAHQPDHPRGDYHAALEVSHGRLMAWPCGRHAVLVCDGWPRADDRGLSFKLLETSRVKSLLAKQPRQVNELLTDVPKLSEFSVEHRALPPRVFDILKGDSASVAGFAPSDDGTGSAPAIYAIDGKAATFRLVHLPFLERTTIPAAVYAAPDGKHHWLTVTDSNHLFVLDERYAIVGDVLWPSEQQGLARLAFDPARGEVWVSVQGSLLIFNTKTFKLTGEIAAAPELRWHRGERVRGFLGGVCLDSSGTRAWLARPLAGDVVEYDARTRKQIGTWPMTVDPLELTIAPANSRVYVQGLRSGAISWFPSP